MVNSTEKSGLTSGLLRCIMYLNEIAGDSYESGKIDWSGIVSDVHSGICN